MLSRTARRLRPALSRARRAHTQSHAASTNRAAQLAAAAAGTAAAAVLLYQSSPRLRRTTPTAECKASSSRNVEDDYELGEMLGDGAFSVVRLARHRKTGKQVAVKVIPRELQSEESIRHEVGVLRRVGMHRAIAKLEDYFESPTHHYIVMEYVDGGELFDHLATAGAYSEKDAAALLQQLAGAVALLHAQKLCHADIKPENLLLTRDGQLKLVDFGLSTQVKKGAAQRMKGTWVNWPPEAFSKSYDVTLAADMWAIGVVAYIMLAGYHPFDCVDGATDTQARAQFRRAIRRAQFSRRNSDVARPTRADPTEDHGGHLRLRGSSVEGRLRRRPRARQGAAKGRPRAPTHSGGAAAAPVAHLRGRK